MRLKTWRVVFFALAAVCILAPQAYAGTEGHYYPGVMGIRDIVIPPEGLYALYYDPFYFSTAYMNKNGNPQGEVFEAASTTKTLNARGNNIPVTLSGSLRADVDMSSCFAMQELLLIWVPGVKVLGADYAMMVVPSMGYVGVDLKAKAHTTGTIQVGDFFSKTVTKDSTISVKSEKYGFGDLLVQPIMLDWRGKNYDIGAYWGFFAPTGAYSENRIANVGMGFWTWQWQAFGAYYFGKERTTAAVLTATYDLNSSIYDKDLAPGQSMTLEYGLSHYLTDRVEIGLTGYSQWQISPDTGAQAKGKDVFYQIHGIGGQIGGWVIKDKLNVTTKCIAEYYGVDRFRGILGTVNLIWVF